MTRLTASQVDLPKTFAAVTRTLKANQAALNDADAYNHNHGDNMVKNFQAITKAMRERKDAPPAEQLSHASRMLAQRSQSGSAQLYAQGLAQAADRFQGQPAVTPDNAMALIQALMGGQAGGGRLGGAQANEMADLLGALMGGAAQGGPQASSGEDLSGLLGGLLGGGTAQQSSPAGTGGDLGDLLGGLLGGGSTAQSGQASGQGGMNLNTLMTAGMAFLQARKQGVDPMQALVQALMAGSAMTNTPYHNQSGQLVAGTLLNTVAGMLDGKKRATRRSR